MLLPASRSGTISYRSAMLHCSPAQLTTHFVDGRRLHETDDGLAGGVVCLDDTATCLLIWQVTPEDQLAFDDTYDSRIVIGIHASRLITRKLDDTGAILLR